MSYKYGRDAMVLYVYASHIMEREYYNLSTANNILKYLFYEI